MFLWVTELDQWVVEIRRQTLTQRELSKEWTMPGSAGEIQMTMLEKLLHSFARPLTLTEFLLGAACQPREYIVLERLVENIAALTEK